MLGSGFRLLRSQNKEEDNLIVLVIDYEIDIIFYHLGKHDLIIAIIVYWATMNQQSGECVTVS